MHMQGGTLKITIDSDWNIRMTGEVREIARGVLSGELIGGFEQTRSGISRSRLPDTENKKSGPDFNQRPDFMYIHIPSKSRTGQDREI